ncbi:unnamed protein product, partial [Laminaria digitata]
MEILRATVAATVAEVAAETYTTSGRNSGGGGFSARSSSTAMDSLSHFERDGRPRMSLPMAGSRSPPRAVTAAAAATAFPGRREPETEDDSAGAGPSEVRGRRTRPEDNDNDSGSGSRERSRSSSSSSSEGFVGGLPLAGSRSPPAHRVVVAPGRREPEYYSDASSLDVGLPEAAVAAAATALGPPLGSAGLSAVRVPSPRLPMPPLR